MRLIGLAVVLAVSLSLAPLAIEAQQAGKVWRIGVLGGRSPSPAADALRQGLRELGYLDGQNIAIEWRPYVSEQLPDLAADLVRLKVDVVIAPNNPSVQAAQKATKTIPIVMLWATDPVGLGFVASLARPGGNITGMSSQETETVGKRLQLLREAVPNLSLLAVLWDSTEPGRRQYLSEIEVAARALGLRLQPLETRSPSEVDLAFTRLTRERAGAVLVGGSAMHIAQRARIAELAAISRVPALCPTREYVAAGCLMSYFVNFNNQWRLAAYFVDKILKGAKPADVPVQQPTKFDLVINLKTAQALGLTIPQTILLQAAEMIEE
jgi:putative ABC transport system substrate-binding protein